MTIASDIHQYDIGTIFQISLVDSANSGIDISSASGANEKFILFKKPALTTLQKPAVFTTDGTDGAIEYTVVSGDLDEVGVWQVQGWVELTDGEWYTNVDTFSVLANVVKVTGT